MNSPKKRNFYTAFLMQKIGEFVVLGVSVSVAMYVSQYFVSDLSDIGIYTTDQLSIARAARGGFAVALAFFLFTLYPVATLLLAAALRMFPRFKQVGVSAAASVVISAGYVMLWTAALDYSFTIIQWSVAAIMAVFIYASSLALYPSGDTDMTRGG